ncbi:MAG: glucosamine-6-phosphate deaminase [Bacillota bacterium]|nr:glucosamine-6-phosphate deaminase [Bacillota bacterium]
MNVIVEEDYAALSQRAAGIVASQVARKPGCVLGLATGVTSIGLYEALVERYRAQEISFSRVTTFNLDEYLGLGPDDPRSFAYFMRRHFFSRVDLDPARVHLLNGVAADPEEECARYETAIAEAGGIDLQVLGVGQNGHIGFNEPGTPPGSLTRVVRLSPETVRRNSRLAGQPVPDRALSMGIKTIMQARRILLLASGRDKAAAVAEALQGEVTPAVPASILQLHPGVTAVLDRDAAALLRNWRELCEGL